jgi:Protein of unknown function (DUF3800)
MGPYGLSGIRLDGDKLVHLVYVDEAGIGNKIQEPWLVVAGVIIDGDTKLNGVKNQLERIMLRHIPKRLQDDFVFHATELFNGGKKLKRQKAEIVGPEEWPLSRRLEIASEILDIPRKFKLPIAIGFIERSAFPGKFQFPEGFTDFTVAGHVVAYLNCAMVAEQWMRKETTNENCLLIVENNDEARTIISKVHRYHQDKTIETLLDAKSRTFFPLRKIQEDPLFQPKKPSNPLILADFCAYVFKQFLAKKPLYKQFMAQIKENLISFEEAWWGQQEEKAARKRTRIIA